MTTEAIGVAVNCYRVQPDIKLEGVEPYVVVFFVHENGERQVLAADEDSDVGVQAMQQLSSRGSPANIPVCVSYREGETYFPELLGFQVLET